MPQSIVKLYVHIVFSTKSRTDLITPEVEPELYAYISGIFKNNDARLLIGCGTANHAHLLGSMTRSDIGELVGDVKRSTSLWMKKQGVASFYWQRGYGAFSIGESQIPAISRYIREQKEHHKKHDFEDEMRAWFRKYEVDFDERYCWD